MAVSARTRSTRPTVALVWQSIPRRQLSSASCLPVQDTTTRYLVLPGCTDSSFTAWNQNGPCFVCYWFDRNECPPPFPHFPTTFKLDREKWFETREEISDNSRQQGGIQLPSIKTQRSITHTYTYTHQRNFSLTPITISGEKISKKHHRNITVSVLLRFRIDSREKEEIKLQDEKSKRRLENELSIR